MGNKFDLHHIAKEYDIPYFEVITEEMVDNGYSRLIPKAWAASNMVFPFVVDGVAYLGVKDEQGLALVQHASLTCGMDLLPAFVPESVIESCINKMFNGSNKDVKNDVEDRDIARHHEKSLFLHETSDLLSDKSEEPITQYLNEIILNAVRKDASDIHIEPDSFGVLRIRYRLYGVLYELPNVPSEYMLPLISRIKVISGMDIAERRLPQDGMTQVKEGNKLIDIRVSTIPIADGERVVLRLLNRDRSLLSLKDLGMSDHIYEGFSKAITMPNGIIIVSGPTGSGKTTTLYSALGSLDSKKKNILTIEDPVEYRLNNIGQIQVRPKIGLTFASGLRHILRQDPDIILVGETRDAETAEIAVKSSLTGHLVFTTLHTNDAPSAVIRLIDMGIEPYLLASCLRGVLAQRLVRKVCPHCVEYVNVDDERLLEAEKVVARSAHCHKVPIVHGCKNCREGYLGRIGIYEYMPCTQEISAMIRSGITSDVDMYKFVEGISGWYSMRDDAYAKLREGVTTPMEILSVIGE